MKIKKVFLMLLLFFWLISVRAYSEIVFENVTDYSGLGDFHECGFGVALLDFNGDGLLDIFVVGQNGLNRLFKNLGNLQFEDVTELVGVQGSGLGWGVCFGDFDADHDEDIYISRRDGQNNDFFVFSGGLFIESAIDYQIDDAGGFGYAACFAPLTKSMALDLIVVNQAWSGQRQSCRFFANNIGYPFSNLTYSSGIADSSQYWDCASTADYDNDNDLDVFISGESQNRLYENDGRGVFANISDSAFINLPRDSDTTGYGISWGDYNNDGNIDYYISNWHDQTGEMYRNNGDRSFSDMTSNLGLGLENWCHSVSFGDFNNDGWLDLYSVTAGSGNKLYENSSGNSFAEISEQAGVVDGNYGCGLSIGDIDADGKLDMVVGHYYLNADKITIFRNITVNNNNWVEIKVNGFYPNPDAIGARVRIVAGGMVQIREVSGGSGFGSQNMLALHFGLGTASIIDTLIITYPSSHIPPLTYYNLQPNQCYELPEIIIDVSSVEILSPVQFHDFSTPLIPCFKIANLGNVDVINFKAVCELINNNQRTRIDSVDISFLSQGDSLILEFSPFILPQSGQSYIFEGIIQLRGDQVRSNDTISTTFFAGYSHDMSAGPTIWPLPESIQVSFEPTALITNIGITPETGFQTGCYIFLQDTTVYSQEMIYSNVLSPARNDTIIYPIFTWPITGQYRVVFAVILENDLNRANDTSIVDIEIDVGNCNYIIGDINNNGITNGVDIIYAVRYFNGGSAPPYLCECPLHRDEYIAGDVNGSCSFDGTDITYLVNFLLGGASLVSCPLCPPAMKLRLNAKISR